MVDGANLSGQFLIAMPRLADPNFDHTVVLICMHSEEGAFGLVVNRPHSVTMDEVAEQMSMTWGRPDKPPVMNGGPVSPERGFVLYEEPLDIPGYVPVMDNLFMGVNPEVLRRLAEPGASAHFLFTLGYSGWGEGQLEAEIQANAWLVADFDRKVLFDTPMEERWAAALKVLGIEPAQLLDMGGMAN